MHIFILKESFELLKTAFNPLLDIKLSDEEIKIITDDINKYASIYCNYHDLKTRKSGRNKYVDLHLVFPDNKSVKDAHDICDEIENGIEKSLKHTNVMIHLESCGKTCDYYKCTHKDNCK